MAALCSYTVKHYYCYYHYAYIDEVTYENITKKTIVKIECLCIIVQHLDIWLKSAVSYFFCENNVSLTIKVVIKCFHSKDLNKQSKYLWNWLFSLFP